MIQTMTDPDIIEWLFLLASTNVERKKVVTNLLQNCSEDGMSPEDAAVCHRGMRLLEAGSVAECAGPRHLVIDVDNEAWDT